MAQANTNDDRINVAAVCGTTVRIYGEMPKDGPQVRPFLWAKEFANYGAAKLFADEYEDEQRSPKAAPKKA